jgi:hypothetical protein
MDVSIMVSAVHHGVDYGGRLCGGVTGSGARW